MRFEVVYLIHNCFLLRFLGTNSVWVFDYPADRYFPPGHEILLDRMIRGRDVTFFISHSHLDHCNARLRILGRSATSIRVFQSWDVTDLHGLLVPGNSVSMEPNETWQNDDLSVKTFESNDCGVAFLLEFRGTLLYHGGDLADWDWEGTGPSPFFLEVLHQLASLVAEKHMPIHCAFSNADPRLSNWSGALDFIRIVQPRLFVLMHMFGDCRPVDAFSTIASNPLTKIFKY